MPAAARSVSGEKIDGSSGKIGTDAAAAIEEDAADDTALMSLCERAWVARGFFAGLLAGPGAAAAAAAARLA